MLIKQNLSKNGQIEPPNFQTVSIYTMRPKLHMKNQRTNSTFASLNSQADVLFEKEVVAVTMN